jgi:hypothetical protein
MIGIETGARVLVAPRPVDFRKGVGSLAALTILRSAPGPRRSRAPDTSISINPAPNGESDASVSTRANAGP